MQKMISTNKARKKIMEDLKTSRDPGLYYVKKLFMRDPTHEDPRFRTKYWVPRGNYEQLINEIAEKEKVEEVIAPPYT